MTTTPRPHIEINEDDFESTYRPRTVPGTDDNVWGWHQLDRDNLHHIWTLVDGDDGGIYAIPGLRIVNKVGYVVTEQPWDTTDHDITGVWMPVPRLEDLPDDEKATVLDLTYADADNWKEDARVVLSGVLSDEQAARAEEVFAAQQSDSFVIPGQLFPGMGHLRAAEAGFPDVDVDHIWHSLELVDREVVRDVDAPEDPVMTVEEFMEAVERIARDGWDELSASEAAGLL